MYDVYNISYTHSKKIAKKKELDEMKHLYLFAVQYSIPILFEIMAQINL